MARSREGGSGAQNEGAAGMIRYDLRALLSVCLVMPASAQRFQADSSNSVKSEIVPNNTNAVTVCSTTCNIYQVDTFNNATTLAYIKIYNGATGTCGQTSPAPIWRGMIPFGQSASGGGFALPNVNGDSYAGGAWMCVRSEE